ncbi:MAG: YqaJ viral recombinase family nuclease [Acidimicrobiales bacterium]
MQNIAVPEVPDATFHAAADRHAWLELRATGIGGSDAGVLLGLSPFASPYALWAEKSGLAQREVSGEAVYWGNALEPVIANRYAAETTDQVCELPSGCYRRNEHPFALATPDRLLVRDGTPVGILEIKTAGLRSAGHWNGEPPVWYQAQLGWYQWTTGLREGRLAVLIGGQEYRVYDLPYDEALGEIFADAGERFTAAVASASPPPVDGHKATTEALKAIYARSDEKVVALDNLAESIAEHEMLRAARDAEQARLDEIENQVKAAMGEASVATLAGDVIATWRNATSKRIDTKALRAEEPEIANRFLAETTSRRFVWKS